MTQIYTGHFKNFPVPEGYEPKPDDKNKDSPPAPKGRKKISDLAECTIPESWGSPLEYMLAVLNDPNVDDDRRDKMAIASASYVHSRLPSTLAYKSKKDQMNQMAKESGAGDEWGELLTNGEKAG